MYEATVPFGASLPRPITLDPSARLVSRAAKRGFDCTVAALLLIVLLPFLAIVVALIAMAGGPVFFGHPRVGRDGRIFHCLKFRTMFPDAEARLQALLATDAALAAEWAAHRKLERDPRITPIGRFLRATSLDELPQLINVLRGEMSIVGPRPVTDDELLRYGMCARAYKSVRPGITGPWQVSGRNNIGYRERVRLDDAYAREWRVGTDLLLVLRTPYAVLSQRGAK
jgi:lipopolysaccharide/colanic/teichoic acid biosynthesis glycosyltransferase